MQVEPLGVLALALGLLGWIMRPAVAIHVFIVSTLLGAGAALILTSLGSANLQPAHLLLALLAASFAIKRENLGTAAPSLVFPREGFWLLLTAVYGTLAAIFFPRLLAGSTYVFAIARTEVGPGIVLTPLAPTSGNITQSVYFIGDVICFLIFYAEACRPAGLRTMTQAILACTAINLIFAALDLATFWTGTSDMLAFMRNASYRMLDDAVVVGFKRIVGSFPEASSFAYATVGLFAFCLKLWLANLYPRSAGALAAVSFLALVFSTSSTGYAGTAGVVAVIYLLSVAQIVNGPVPKPTLAFAVGLPFIAMSLVLSLALYEPAWLLIQDMIDKTIVNKLASDSGIERTMWNHQAVINLIDTAGLGAGVGSVRASSFPLAVLGNIGAFGALTYAAFLCCIFFRRQQRGGNAYSLAVRSAARSACLAQLLAASVAGSFIDLGLPFFVFAAVACARPEAVRASRSSLATLRSGGTSEVPA